MIRANNIITATLARLRRARYSDRFKGKTSFACMVCSYQNMNGSGFYERNPKKKPVRTASAFKQEDYGTTCIN